MMNFLYRLFSQSSGKDSGPTMSRPTHTRGLSGDLNVEAALAFEDERLVLALDYDFTEAPSYVEFDMQSRHIRIAQSTGDMATLIQVTVPMQEKERIQKISRIALVTGTGEEKLMQIVPLRLKHAAVPEAASA